MSVWADIRKRGIGREIKKEDEFVFSVVIGRHPKNNDIIVDMGVRRSMVSKMFS